MAGERLKFLEKHFNTETDRAAARLKLRMNSSMFRLLTLIFIFATKRMIYVNALLSLDSSTSVIFSATEQKYCSKTFVRCNGSVVGQTRLQQRQVSLPLRSSSSNFAESFSGGTRYLVSNRLNRQDARELLENPCFLPSREYGDRIVFGRQAAEREHGEGSDTNDGSDEVGIMMSDDPRLARTYAEFPLESLDVLVDAAIQHLPAEPSAATRRKMVDLGSGLGRIVLYSALTRGCEHFSQAGEAANRPTRWEVCGIEISTSLHTKAMELVQTGIDRKLFEKEHHRPDEDTDHSQSLQQRLPSSARNSFSLHQGSVTDESMRDLLVDADLVFAYSTAFSANGFDPDVGALVLDTEEWSLPLSEACPHGCVAVTTDRALNPNLGWKIVERMEVENPEVLGTTGFIHVLEKREAANR